jgi:hypothetical protein
MQSLFRELFASKYLEPETMKSNKFVLFAAFKTGEN